MELYKIFVYYQIMHIIIIVHKIFNVKVGLNTIKFKFSCNHIYDTKVFQILYSTYHELNRGPCFLIFLLSQVFNLFSCVYIKKIIIFKLHFGCITFCVYFTMLTPFNLHGLKNDMFWTCRFYKTQFCKWIMLPCVIEFEICESIFFRVKTWLKYPKGLSHFIFTRPPHLNMLLKLNDTFILKVWFYS
jgi:hypothetical protein